MSRSKLKTLPRHKGAITTAEKGTRRYHELINAVKAQELNEDKVRVPVYGKKRGTYLMVYRSQFDQYMKKYRLEQAKDPANKRKVDFLTRKGWHMRADGIWMNRFEFLQKDFKTALECAKYYEHLKVTMI